MQGWVKDMASYGYGYNEPDDPVIEDKVAEEHRSEEDVDNLLDWRYYPQPDYDHYPEHVHLLMENDVEVEPDQ